MLWLDQLHPESGDRIIQAINYSNGCRPYMMNYLKDGACSLSNNLSENSIRPLVVGRKNWFFSDTPAGADANMKVYSIIETAKAAMYYFAFGQYINVASSYEILVVSLSKYANLVSTVGNTTPVNFSPNLCCPVGSILHSFIT